MSRVVFANRTSALSGCMGFFLFFFKTNSLNGSSMRFNQPLLAVSDKTTCVQTRSNQRQKHKPRREIQRTTKLKLTAGFLLLLSGERSVSGVLCLFVFFCFLVVPDDLL